MNKPKHKPAAGMKYLTKSSVDAFKRKTITELHECLADISLLSRDLQKLINDRNTVVTT